MAAHKTSLKLIFSKAQSTVLTQIQVLLLLKCVLKSRCLWTSVPKVGFHGPKVMPHGKQRNAVLARPQTEPSVLLLLK